MVLTMPLYVEFAFYAKWPKPVKALLDFIDTLPPHHATPELRIDCPDDEKFSIMEQIANRVSKKTASTNVTLIDGVRVRSDNGWWFSACLKH